MDAWWVDDLVRDLARQDSPYLEFLRVPSMSAGVYALPAGGVDPQKPHTEDEVYHVVRGAGCIRVGEEEREVGPGSVIFVGAGMEHRFHSIVEDLVVLVLFAPSEYSKRG